MRCYVSNRAQKHSMGIVTNVNTSEDIRSGKQKPQNKCCQIQNRNNHYRLSELISDRLIIGIGSILHFYVFISSRYPASVQLVHCNCTHRQQQSRRQRNLAIQCLRDVVHCKSSSNQFLSICFCVHYRCTTAATGTKPWEPIVIASNAT